MRARLGKELVGERRQNRGLWPKSKLSWCKTHVEEGVEQMPGWRAMEHLLVVQHWTCSSAHWPDMHANIWPAIAGFCLCLRGEPGVLLNMSAFLDSPVQELELLPLPPRMLDFLLQNHRRASQLIRMK
jgi:hypothetical protein